MFPCQMTTSMQHLRCSVICASWSGSSKYRFLPYGCILSDGIVLRVRRLARMTHVPSFSGSSLFLVGVRVWQLLSQLARHLRPLCLSDMRRDPATPGQRGRRLSAALACSGWWYHTEAANGKVSLTSSAKIPFGS